MGICNGTHNIFPFEIIGTPPTFLTLSYAWWLSGCFRHCKNPVDLLFFDRVLKNEKLDGTFQRGYAYYLINIVCNLDLFITIKYFKKMCCINVLGHIFKNKNPACQSPMNMFYFVILHFFSKHGMKFLLNKFLCLKTNQTLPNIFLKGLNMTNIHMYIRNHS